MVDVGKIMEFEDGEMSEEEMIEMFQEMINDGSVWSLQGSYGRTAMNLIDSGKCMLGEHGCRDYYGNYIPSRTEVKPGTEGSPEFVEERKG